MKFTNCLKDIRKRINLILNTLLNSLTLQEKKNQNARNDDSDSDDDLESLSNFLSGPSTISTMMTRYYVNYTIKNV